MGWKKVKDYYSIKHTVHVRDGNICIGSAYIPCIIVINHEGIVINDDGKSNTSLVQAVAAFKADPAILKCLIEEKDEFVAHLPVWSFNENSIIEQRCEKHGWPNVTFDGQLMYENTHFPTRALAIEAAKKSAQSTIDYYLKEIKQTEKKLEAMRGEFMAAVAERDRLNSLEA